MIGWHDTMLVNSATHIFGNGPNRDGMGSEECNSRNVAWLQPFLNGENWHNNHGAPSSASNWVHWYQLDTNYMLIRVFEFLGLFHDVRVEQPVLKDDWDPAGPDGM